MIVVARSSNPEGRDLQQAVTAGGTAVEDMLLAEIAELNGSPGGPRRDGGRRRRGHAGAVGFALSQLGGVILAPGLGAQGAGPADVAARFAGCRPGTVAAEQLTRAARGRVPIPPPCGERRTLAEPRAGGGRWAEEGKWV